jgi:RNA polymerase sigma-70 factor (ECF subfamily)
MENDEILVEKYRAGNNQAFETLLHKYLKPVYNFLYQIARDKKQVEDLAQETFIKAWKNISRFNQEKKFKTWLFTIAKNTAFDYLKKKKTLAFSDFAGDDGYNKLENIAGKVIISDEILAQKDIEKYVVKALQKMPEKYGAILTLCYKEDFTLVEAAEILGEPYNTVKSRHNRALKILRKELEMDAPKFC